MMINPVHRTPSTAICGVYALIDLGEPSRYRYIGSSGNVEKRFVGHLARPSQQVGEWLKTATAGCVLLQVVPWRERAKHEAFWLAKAIEAGGADLNRCSMRGVRLPSVTQYPHGFVSGYARIG